MFKYFFKKGAYNLIIEKYEQYISVYEEEIKKSPELSGISREELMAAYNETAEYKCYSDFEFERELGYRYDRGNVSELEKKYVEERILIRRIDRVARQKYYEIVFDSVCQEFSNNLPRFKTMLLLNISAFDMPEELSPTTIYEFLYFSQYRKEDRSSYWYKICDYVFKLMRKTRFKYKINFI